MKKRILIAGCLFGGLLLAGSAAGVRLNKTASLPRGLYHVEAAEIKRGDIVLACPEQNDVQREARKRGYLHYGAGCPGGFAPLFKRVVALPGDHVQITADGIAVNGQPVANTARLAADSQGRVMPPLPESGKVPPGMVWLVSNYAERSYDSRYFGPVLMSTVRGRATPLWTDE